MNILTKEHDTDKMENTENRLPTKKIKKMRSILPRHEYDSAAVVAKALYEEDCLDAPTVEALTLRTIRIIIKEYEENPVSFVSYYKRKKMN
jgi:hypothetical protein